MIARFMKNSSSVAQCKLHIEILDYDWLKDNRKFYDTT